MSCKNEHIPPCTFAIIFDDGDYYIQLVIFYLDVYVNTRQKYII